VINKIVAAAVRRNAGKRRGYNRLAPNGYSVVSPSAETYGRLRKPAVALRELSVCLCKGKLPDASGITWCAGVLPARERIGPLRLCVTGGVLRAVRCFPCL
jgi:hypothetical protein